MPPAALLLSILAAAGDVGAQTYRAFPVESPNHGPRALLANPSDPVASPFGWHDTNGVAGAEFTTLRGNNAYVYLDVDANGAPDALTPDGGATLAFDFPFSPADAPSAYYAALMTNAFYWTSHLHDIFQRHGFTPARGNMQANTYGQGGIGNDPVKVEVAKGNGVNNVTYVNAADGVSPTIRTYVWNYTTPNRESSFDAGTMAWAYTILMFNRLVSASSCASAAETPYMGYADFFGILVTTDFHTATPSGPRGLGTYVLGQPVNGTGIRDFPYSTDLAVFPRTYANLPSLQTPHGTGSVYAATLWDLTWLMVTRYGASHDLLNGSGAENRMLRLAIEGMDTMACPGGFVSARESILAADQTLHGGADRCLIWQAFARRGLGNGAAEGSANSIADQVASFTLPIDCDHIFDNGFQ
ncbi:MAG: M36 family metallopeptidase [Xanthomonadales bacterium]|nr:M36 family metallopeptidase [Xanthomonadales bacterium]